MASVVRLEWQVDSQGYEIVERVHERSAKSPGSILDSVAGPYFVVAPKGGRLKRRVLEGTDNRVFLELANTPTTTAGVIAFANKYGLLGPPPDHDLDHYYSCITSMRSAVELATTASVAEVERRLRKNGIKMRMRFGRLAGDSAPRVILEADHLLGFCQAEFIQFLDGGIEIRQCPRCRTLLARGNVGQQPTYCSDKCRVAMHRRKKRERTARSSSKRTAVGTN